MATIQEIRCSLCGKLLAKRDTVTQEITFLFGKKVEGDEIIIPVDIKITGGTVRMRCIRRHCRKESPDHWNIIDNNI